MPGTRASRESNAPREAPPRSRRGLVPRRIPVASKRMTLRNSRAVVTSPASVGAVYLSATTVLFRYGAAIGSNVMPRAS